MTFDTSKRRLTVILIFLVKSFSKQRLIRFYTIISCPAKHHRGRSDRWTDWTWIHCRPFKRKRSRICCRSKVQLHFLLCWAMLVGRISKQVDKTTFLQTCSFWFFKKILRGNTILIELSVVSFKIDTTYMAKIIAWRLLCWSSSTGSFFLGISLITINRPLLYSYVFDLRTACLNNIRFTEWIGSCCEDRVKWQDVKRQNLIG